jgi:hypothetical protein
VAIAVVRRWRLTYGPLVVAAALLSTVLVLVATERGEALEEKVGDPGRHAELGEQLLWFALPLLVLVAALVWMERRSARGGLSQGGVGRRRSPAAALSISAGSLASCP